MTTTVGGTGIVTPQLTVTNGVGAVVLTAPTGGRQLLSSSRRLLAPQVRF